MRSSHPAVAHCFFRAVCPFLLLASAVFVFAFSFRLLAYSLWLTAVFALGFWSLAFSRIFAYLWHSNYQESF